MEYFGCSPGDYLFFSCILEKPGWGWVWLKPFLFSFLILNTMPKYPLFTQTLNPNPGALLSFPPFKSATTLNSQSLTWPSSDTKPEERNNLKPDLNTEHKTSRVDSNILALHKTKALHKQNESTRSSFPSWRFLGCSHISCIGKPGIL